MSSPSLSARQEQMRQRYLPAAERGEKGRDRPTRRADSIFIGPAPCKKHKSEECEIGYHYLDCPDLKCDCTCHNDEYKGEPAQ